MLRQILDRIRNTSRKSNNRSGARGAFRRRLFMESLEDRRLLAITVAPLSPSVGNCFPFGEGHSPSGPDP